jgi:hypothetical protein
MPRIVGVLIFARKQANSFTREDVENTQLAPSAMALKRKCGWKGGDGIITRQRKQLG